MGKAITTGSKEQERVITDQLCYGCGSKEHKMQKCKNRSNIFVTNSQRRGNEMNNGEIWGGEEHKTKISSK